MPFGVVTGVGRVMGVLHGVVIVKGEGALLDSCAEVREQIELSFGVVFTYIDTLCAVLGSRIS